MVVTSGTLSIGGITYPNNPQPIGGTFLRSDRLGKVVFSSSNIRVTLGTDDTYSINKDDDIIAVKGTGDKSITLPDPTTKAIGEILHITKEISDENNITIIPFGSETISGESSIVINGAYDAVSFYTDGLNWFRLSNTIPTFNIPTNIPHFYLSYGQGVELIPATSIFTADSLLLTPLTIVGDSIIGSNLSVSEYGRLNSTLPHQWTRDGIDIVGETGVTYLVTLSDYETDINLKVSNDTSNTISILPWNPAYINPEIWLDGSSTDSYGLVLNKGTGPNPILESGNNQVPTTINGINAITLNGQIYTMPDQLGANPSSFAVVILIRENTRSTPIFSLNGSESGFDSRCSFHPPYSDGIVYLDLNGMGLRITQNIGNTGQSFIISWHSDTSTITANVYSELGTQFQTTIPDNGNTCQTSGGLRLTPSGGNYSIGDMVVSSTMTVAELLMVEGYSAWKYGLESILPIDHPYKTAPPF